MKLESIINAVLVARWSFPTAAGDDVAAGFAARLLATMAVVAIWELTNGTADVIGGLIFHRQSCSCKR